MCACVRVSVRPPPPLSLGPVYTLLARQFLNSPPQALQWLSQCLSADQKDSLVAYVTDPKTDMEGWGAGLAAVVNATKSRMADVLTLRGLLGGGLLAHCLTLRPNVNYGEPVDREKRLGVPYVASDTPHPRSEFSQPDKV
jgi:hypothetical protein